MNEDFNLDECEPDTDVELTTEQLAQLFPIFFRPLTEEELEEDGGSERS